MILATGALGRASPQADLLSITTHSTLQRDGGLVMGKGITGAAARRFPTLPHLIFTPRSHTP